MRQPRRVAGALIALSTALAGCAAAPETPSEAAAGDGPPASTQPSTPSPSASPAPSTSPSPSSTPPPTPTPSPTPSASAAAEASDEELAALEVNELGRVLVAEWHRIGDTDGEYATSRATFRAQLQDLHDRGYRPVTQAEFIAGTFPIPAGTSPVVLTFDDSTRDQFALGEDGAPVADTAVGIIEQFAQDKPDWRPTAVFAYNFPQPFGDAGFAEKLQWLVDNGYELANHSVGHVNLGSMSATEAVANLADNQARLHEVVPDAAVPALTLPYGAHAADPAVELGGTADGVTYQHHLVYLVGAYPTRSPHDAAFDPGAVQRVPAHAVVGTGPEWFGDQLDALEEDGRRFVSDGDPTTVTYPSDLAGEADVADPALTIREYGT